jgi:hypothetical protein
MRDETDSRFGFIIAGCEAVDPSGAECLGAEILSSNQERALIYAYPENHSHGISTILTSMFAIMVTFMRFMGFLSSRTNVFHDLRIDMVASGFVIRFNL